MIGEIDRHLFNEGTHRFVHHALGAHPDPDGGTWFAVWAPSAQRVDVVGDFAGWHDAFALAPQGSSGIWAGHIPAAHVGHAYRYGITGPDGHRTERSDPVAAANHLPPSTASLIADLSYDWGDADWMARRGGLVERHAPISIYEVHLGSWGRQLVPGRRWPRYDELADSLADHAAAHGFTHVELLPIMEHPFYGSWGYQTTGYFAPTARYGSPVDLMAMIDRLHQRGVGVILDWVPSHFPMDGHALARFDGTHLYEHADPRQGYHPDWTSAIFNYGRAEVRSFLVSSAMSWLERYHVDGLRVDAVASMLYLDYSREPGEWVPNVHGGRENLEAIAFLQQLNASIQSEFPDVATFAEESTAWPKVTGAVADGGLGFNYKWDMGWMHDTLQYLARDPVHRRFHHDEITFRNVYAFSERYVLPLSHDEVVHGKGSLLTKMPGDDWQKFANLRLLYGLMWGQPGKKLLFMGGELAARAEWDHESTLDWALHDSDAADGRHAGVRRLITDLNRVYRETPALHRGDTEQGMQYVIGDDDTHSVFAWLRSDPTAALRSDPTAALRSDPTAALRSDPTAALRSDPTAALRSDPTAALRSDPTADSLDVLVVANATPTVHHGYRIGVPRAGDWAEVINTDSTHYGGSGLGNLGLVRSDGQAWHGYAQSLVLTLPPLSVLYLRAV